MYIYIYIVRFLTRFMIVNYPHTLHILTYAYTDTITWSGNVKTKSCFTHHLLIYIYIYIYICYTTHIYIHLCKHIRINTLFTHTLFTHTSIHTSIHTHSIYKSFYTHSIYTSIYTHSIYTHIHTYKQVLAHKVSIVEQEGNFVGLRVSGYVKGKAIYADQLIHIPSHGTFQIKAVGM